MGTKLAACGPVGAQTPFTLQQFSNKAQQTLLPEAERIPAGHGAAWQALLKTLPFHTPIECI
jgi:hypothetical protein